MMSTRSHLDGYATGMMILLCAIWGLHQVAIKAAAPDVAPIMQIALRSGISALLVGIFILCSKERFFTRDGTLAAGALVGILFAAEFFFVAEGLRHTTASRMSVFLYTAPIYTALALQWLQPSERMRPHHWIGILIAFAGIVLALTGGSFLAGTAQTTLWGDLLGLIAGALWGACTVLVRCSKLAEASPPKTLIYQLIAAFILLLIASALTGQARHLSMTPIAWTSLLFQGVIVTFASYLAWFSLLRRYLASRLSVFSFLSPLFGVAFGVLLLKESVDVFFAAGAVLVLLGITLVSRPTLFTRER